MRRRRNRTTGRSPLGETAAAEYWLEARSLPTVSFDGSSIRPPGILVLGGPSTTIGGVPALYPEPNLLLPNPSGGVRYSYGVGETVRVPNVFEMTVERNDMAGASLRFAWVDRTAPPRPRLIARAKRGRSVRLEWEPSVDRGSGRVGYVLVVDGRDVRRLRASAFAAAVSLRRGVHRVGITALDRAGNRSRTASIRVTIR